MALPNALPLRSLDYHSAERLPESDGKPMAETDVHRDQMVDIIYGLREHLRPHPLCYVSGNIFVYYRDEAGERHSVSPDVLVVLGVENKERRYYNLEVEGKAPDLIIELISTSTKLEDLGSKRVLYASLGVREYYIFDPLREVLPGQLRGFRLYEGEYLPVVGSRLQSQVLEVDFEVEQGWLRLYDRKTGQRLLTHSESEAARKKAEAKAARTETRLVKAESEAAQAAARAQQETIARQAAEAELQHLRTELAKLRGQAV